MSRHIGQFETLRGIAATWVFISHALLIAEFPLPLLSNGDLAVDVFVLLSGFVITLLVFRRPEPYGWYIFRRGIRLYPLYFIALMLGWATQGLYQPVIGESLFGTMAQANFFQRVAIIEASLPEHLALHLTMLHGAVPDAILPLSALAFSGPLWSISLEWQFYLVAPLLIWCLDVRQPGRIRWAAIAVVATIIINVISRLYWHANVPSFLPLRLPLFAAGIVSGVFWQRAQEVSLVRLGAILTGVAMLLVVSRISPIPLAAWVVTYWAAAAAGRSSWADRFNHFLMLKPLRWLGERSYGVYVLHMPVVLAISAWLIVPYARAWGQAVTLVALFACFPVVLLLATVLYRTVERPVVNWAKRLGGGKPQVPVSDVTQKTRAAI